MAGYKAANSANQAPPRQTRNTGIEGSIASEDDSTVKSQSTVQQPVQQSQQFSSQVNSEKTILEQQLEIIKRGEALAETLKALNKETGELISAAKDLDEEFKKDITWAGNGTIKVRIDKEELDAIMSAKDTVASDIKKGLDSIKTESGKFNTLCDNSATIIVGAVKSKAESDICPAIINNVSAELKKITTNSITEVDITSKNAIEVVDKHCDERTEKARKAKEKGFCISSLCAYSFMALFIISVTCNVIIVIFGGGGDNYWRIPNFLNWLGDYVGPWIIAAVVIALLVPCLIILWKKEFGSDSRY